MVFLELGLLSEEPVLMLTNIQNPQSICILRLSAIGDVCHAVASVQAIQKRWPQAAITWVIGKIEHKLLEGLPGVEFVIFNKNRGLKGYLELNSILKNRQFDILLHMQVAFRASLATLCIKAKEKWGFDHQRAREGQSLFTGKRILPQDQPHVAEGFMGFAKAVGVPDDQPFHWEMPISPADVEWQRKQFDSIGKYVVISAAASKAERNWLPERYAAFANYVSEQGFSVVLCGGPSPMEHDLATAIESFCQKAPLNLVGKTSLKQLLVVLKEAKMVLAPDTGPVHMAVTVGTPVIGLYAHSNPKRTGPYLFQNYVVSCHEDVSKVKEGTSFQSRRWGQRVKGSNLMQRIEVDRVLDTFDRLKKEFSL